MIIVQLFIGIIFALGAGMILCDIFKIPTLKVSRATHNLGKKGDKKVSPVKLFLDGFAEEFAQKIKLNEWKKKELEKDLLSAGLGDVTPEQFTARAMTKAFAVGIFAIPAFFVFKVLGILFIGLAFFVYFMETRSITSKIKKKRAKIEAELPRFVGTVNNKLTHTRDVIEILTAYKETAGEEFKEELTITVAEMNIGANKTEALTHLEERVGSSLLSEVTLKLKAVIEGNYSEASWTMLASTFAQLQKDNLKKQANTIPRKCRKNSIALLICFILIYVVVLGQVLISSLGGIF